MDLAGRETEIGGPQPNFQPTLWTIVLKAKDPSSPERQASLQRLIETYWKPCYFFIRRKGHDVESAKDLTQAFFAAFIEKDFLKDVSQDRGRFRSFVRVALTHFLANEYDRSKAKKRGGDFNFVEAETEIVSADPDPEKAFFAQWAVEVMGRAMARLKEECDPDDFRLLSGARPEGMPDHDRKNRLHRMRARLRELLIQEVLPSVGSPEEAEAELRELLAVSARRV